MAILVDSAVWPWRGDRWAHLVSDTDTPELHRFAHRLGVPYVAFQGDHYDVPSGLRVRALALGAEAVDARDLVRRLRAAGLRDRRAHRRWHWSVRDVPADGASRRDAAVIDGHLPAAAVDRAMELAGELAGGARSSPRLSVGARPGERLVSWWVPDARPLPGDPLVVDDRWTVHRTSGARGSFVELSVETGTVR